MSKILITLLLFASHCMYAQHFTNEITIVQYGIEEKITSENIKIHLKKQPFAIQFQSRLHNSSKEVFNGLKVTIVKERSNMPVIEEGNLINLIPFLEEVAVVLPDNNGYYTTAEINKYAHHYLFYENESHKNVELMAKKKELGLFEWNINRFNFEGKQFPIEKWNENQLTFIFLNDFNSNKVIDADELRIVQIQFE